MGKISDEARQQYYERIKEYKQAAEAILQREQSIQKILSDEDPGTPYKRITMAEDRLNLASYYLLQNRVSVALLGVKADSFLNDARKSCYQSVIYLEDVVSSYVDAPFSDYEERLDSIEGIDDQKRYHLVRKLGFTIQSVEEEFGPNTKWKWSFVELEGRFTTVAKNIIDFKNLVSKLDPRVDGYKERVGHLDLVKELLMKSADRYREKYELSTNRIDDFKTGVAFLSALKRIHTILSEPDQAEQVKKKLDVWKSKLTADEKRLGSKQPKS
ncbi:MAG: hypothetical protein ACOC25_04890 [Alkalispirochaetaceae bacterium]